MTLGVWFSIDGRCLVMKTRSSLTLLDQKTGRFSLVTYRPHFRSWPGAGSDQSRMERQKLSRLTIGNVHIWLTGDRGRWLRFLVCALGQFFFERKEHPLTAQLYVVKVFHSLTHKACLLIISQREVSDYLCQSSKLVKHKTREGKPH